MLQDECYMYARMNKINKATCFQQQKPCVIIQVCQYLEYKIKNLVKNQIKNMSQEYEFCQIQENYLKNSSPTVAYVGQEKK